MLKSRKIAEGIDMGCWVDGSRILRRSHFRSPARAIRNASVLSSSSPDSLLFRPDCSYLALFPTSKKEKVFPYDMSR